MAAPSSPSDEISIRPTSASPPSFSGLTPILPTAIRQLRQHNPPAQPSEMTVLANRLRGVHLDQSPKKDISPHVLPQKLLFSDHFTDSQSPLLSDEVDSRTSSDKENPQKQRDFDPNVISLKNSSMSHISDTVLEPSTISRAGDSTPKIAVPLTTSVDLSAHSSEVTTNLPLSESGFLPTTDPSPPSSVSGLTSALPADQSLSKSQVESPLLRHIEKILHDNSKFGWHERTASLKALASAVRENLNEDVKRLLIEHYKSLATKIGENLAELRPSIITSTLHLINAILESSLPSQDFIASVFPHLTTVACEHSLKADDAVYSLVLVLNKHAHPEFLLSQTNNISRLENAFRNYMKRNTLPDMMVAPTQNALQYIVQTAANKSHSSLTPAPCGASPFGSNNQDRSSFGVVPEAEPRPSLEGMSNRDTVSEAAPVPEPEQKRDIQRSVDRVRSLRLSRMSWRAKLESPALSSRSGIAHTNDSNKPPRTSENVVSDNSNRTTSSGFRGRTYSKEEVEEIRQTAIEAVIERLEQEHREERDRLQREKVDTERELEKERGDNSELRSVLEEYEVTMKQMVSQTNSQLNAHQMALESENTRLKTELQDTTEAFDKLKEKYETTKQAVERMETKEGRLVEQVQELKKNMVELQNWSNDLKANTEKKLTKAFESVTSYRAMYMDKEAHERKAISDAEKLRLEFEKSSQNLRETAAKLAYFEGELHKEQDARADLSGQLSSAKATILRLTTQRETSQQQLDQNVKVISGMKQRIGELEGTVSRMSDTKKQLDLLRVERQELKARAFDDMKRIESMERELNMKDKELEEMNAICDQAVGELERWKHSQST